MNDQPSKMNIWRFLTYTLVIMIAGATVEQLMDFRKITWRLVVSLAALLIAGAVMGDGIRRM